MKCFCGTDIIEVSRVKKAILSTLGFRENVFTSYEISYAESKSEITRYQHYAGRFAAKEAIYKSLSKIDNSLSISEIEIVNDTSNKKRPVVNILKPSIHSLQESGQLTLDVSISHISEYATATSIATLN